MRTWNRQGFNRKFFLRFKKFLRSLKIDFWFKAGISRRGVKKIQIILLLIFALVDRMNMNFKNDLALPPLEQFAQEVGCHISWVKQVKAKYFPKKLTREEFEQLRQDFGWKFCFDDLHSYKDLINAEIQHSSNYCSCDVSLVNSISPFVSKSKLYLNFYKRNSKTFCFKKFFRYCSLNFTSFFDKWLSKKTQKVKKNWFSCLFEFSPMWKNSPWLWKALTWLQNNFELVPKKTGFITKYL